MNRIETIIEHERAKNKPQEIPIPPLSLQELIKILPQIFMTKGDDEEIVVLIDRTLNNSRVIDALIPFADTYHIEPKGVDKSWSLEAEMVADLLIVRGSISNEIMYYKQALVILKYLMFVNSKVYSINTINKVRELERRVFG